MVIMKLGTLTRIRTGKLDANASSVEGKYPFFTCAIEPLKIKTYSYNCECVLVAGNGDLNVKYYNGKFDAYQRTYIIESIDPAKLVVRYMFLFLEKYVETLRTQAIGGVIKYIKLGNLTEAAIPLPPLETQKQVAAILDKASQLIELRKQQLKKMDLLIKSKFIAMFGDPVTNPMGWDMIPLSSLGTWSSGGTPSRSNLEYFDGNIDWYSAGELNTLFLNESTEKITKEAIKKSAAKIFKKGSLLLGMYDTAAFKMGILKKEAAANQACANIDINGVGNILWLYFVLQNMKKHFLKNRRGIRQKNLNLGMIKAFNVPVPPRKMQNEFAAFVEKVEQQKAIMQASLEKMEINYKALMQQYFG